MSVADLVESNAATGLRQMLRLACGQAQLLVPIDVVREILEHGRLTVLPRTPDFLHGVMNLRGAVIPVVDLHARFGFGRAVVEKRSAIVVVEVPDSQGHDMLAMGLLVDAVFEVLDVESTAVEAVPPLGMLVPPAFVAGMVNVRDSYACLLNLAHTLSPPELARLIGQGQGQSQGHGQRAG
jgi:purine-binding chemotaxis protein CheW